MNTLQRLKLHSELERYSLADKAEGRPTFFAFNPETGEFKKIITRRNKILYSGADVLAQLMSGHPEYAPTTMYMEFSTDPDDPVEPPDFDRGPGSGIEYYNGLEASEDKDFLRLALTVNPLVNSSNDELYAGNQVTYFAISEGSVGRWGKAFVNGCAVFGAAIVAAPDPDDPSKDVVFSRVYTGIETIFKEAGFQIGVTWQIRYS